MDFLDDYNNLVERTSDLTQYSDKQLQELLHDAKNVMNEYDNLQNVIKVDCNSLYGSFANNFFEMTDCDIAEDITGIGRHTATVVDIALNKFFTTWANDDKNLKIIQEFYPNVKELLNFDYIKDTEKDICVYGDTDSRYLDISMVYNLINTPLPPNTDEGNKELIDFAIFLNEKFFAEIIRVTIEKDLLSRGGIPGHLKMAHEVVSRKSIYLKKKMYIMSLVWKDEKILKPMKLKYMGVSLKRGETSPKLKKIIEKLVYKYLVDEKDFNYIKLEAQKLRRYLISKGEKGIVCKATSVSGVSELTFDGKVWKHPKGHLQAQLMENWMNFIQENGLTSTYKNVFEKQKMYYYKTVSPKYKYIGVPDDVDIDTVKGLPEPDWDEQINDQFIKPLLKCLIPDVEEITPQHCRDFLTNVSTNKITV